MAHRTPHDLARRLTVSPAEASELTGLSRSRLYELIADGSLQSTRVGARRLVFVHSIRRLLGLDGDQEAA